MNFHSIWTIARFEAKLLLRSWAFRIFSAGGFLILLIMDIAVGSKVADEPHYMVALSSALPLANLKMLNVYQGIIAAFLATEFMKRDRKHDTTQVFYVRSYSNWDYILGKLAGITTVFGFLNIAVLFQVLIIHLFFSHSPFAWQPYLYFLGIISIPTLFFMIGMSFLLITVLRSQALVFVIMLAYSLLVLIMLGGKYFNILDSFALWQPITYSDFNGLGDLKPLLLIRGAYFMFGLGLISLAVLTTRRLRQSITFNSLAGFIAVGSIAIACTLGVMHINDSKTDLAYREKLKELSITNANYPTATIRDYKIDLKLLNREINVVSKITTVNETDTALDSVFFTLNPGLTISSITSSGASVNFDRNEQICWVKPDGQLGINDSLILDVAYTGAIDDRVMYLDIEQERLDALYYLWMIRVKKQYSYCESDYLHLTPEAAWYPIAGVPHGAALPASGAQRFATYQLSATVPAGLTVISQNDGEPEIVTNESGVTYKFTSEQVLPQISLTAGNYERRSIDVDSVNYSLYFLPGHNYFDEYFENVGDTIEYLIRDLRNGYEVPLGIKYPYSNLSIVEVPAGFYSYERLWTSAQEMVQPQIVFMPEMGVVGDGTDLDRAKRSGTRRQERNNQEESSLVLESGYFNNFVKADLLAQNVAWWGIRRRVDFFEPRYELFSNFVSYKTRIVSDQWPVLNRAIESYYQQRVKVPDETFSRMWRGLTDTEKANLALKRIPFKDLLSNTKIERDIRQAALTNKCEYLLLMMEAKIGPDIFSEAMDSYLENNANTVVPESTFMQFASEMTNSDFAGIVDQWYADTVLAGYYIENVECYKVIDGERTRTQVKFKLTNPTKTDGALSVNIRYRKKQADRHSGRDQPDYTRTLFVPALTRHEIGIIVDDEVSNLQLGTFVSQNIPSVLQSHFREQKLRDDEIIFEGEIVDTFDLKSTVNASEYVVDNEDLGFEATNSARENWLRLYLLKLIGDEEENDVYHGMRFWDPPGTWLATTDQRFHGRFIHSAYYKRSGDGTSIVSWAADLEEAGDYDVYYYCEGEQRFRWWRRRNRGKMVDKGEKQFIVHHVDGSDDVPLDLNGVEEGWNFLGTFRFKSGENWIDLTDKTTAQTITADAIKWVKR